MLFQFPAKFHNIGVSFTAPQAYDWFKQKHKLKTLDETQKDQAWKTFAVEKVKERAKALGSA